LQAEKKGLLQKKKYDLISVSSLYKQQLSHQLIAGQFIKINLKKIPGAKNNPVAIGWLWLAKNKLSKYAFPKFINLYLFAPKPPVLF
jgi:A/G-specific adenine glycosylase